MKGIKIIGERYTPEQILRMSQPTPYEKEIAISN